MARLRLITLMTSALVLFATPVAAEPNPAPAVSAPEQCGGTNMVAELAAKDPAAHSKIVDEAAKIENGDVLLWKIEKGGLPPSYLFGTIHVADKRVTALPEKAQAALAGSKTLAVEIANMTDEGMLAAMTKVPELLAYRDGTTLQAQLTPDEYGKVQALITKSGMPAEAAVVLRPWLVSMLLAISECHRKQMEAGMQPLDGRIEETAKAAGTKIVGLETAESQLAAMASIPNDKQVLILKAGLAYADRTDDMIETIVQLYLQRKIAAAMPFQFVMAEKAGFERSTYDEFMKILINDRNIKMRDGAKPLLEQGNAFIAVGSLHLPGEHGLVKLLRDEGYQVTAAE